MSKIVLNHKCLESYKRTQAYNTDPYLTPQNAESDQDLFCLPKTIGYYYTHLTNKYTYLFDKAFFYSYSIKHYISWSTRSYAYIKLGKCAISVFRERSVKVWYIVHDFCCQLVSLHVQTKTTENRFRDDACWSVLPVRIKAYNSWILWNF